MQTTFNSSSWVHYVMNISNINNKNKKIKKLQKKSENTLPPIQGSENKIRKKIIKSDQEPFPINK